MREEYEFSIDEVVVGNVIHVIVDVHSYGKRKRKSEVTDGHRRRGVKRVRKIEKEVVKFRLRTLRSNRHAINSCFLTWLQREQPKLPVVHPLLGEGHIDHVVGLIERSRRMRKVKDKE